MTDPACHGNPDQTNAGLVAGCGYLGRQVAALWSVQARRVFAVART